MCLVFKKIKISSKIAQQSSKGLKKSTADIFRCENATGYVLLNQLHFKLQKAAELMHLEANKRQRRFRLT